MAAHPNDTRVTEITGIWHVAPLTRKQLAEVPQRLVTYIRTSDILEIDSINASQIISLTETVASLKPQIIPHLFGGNTHLCVPAYMDTFNYITEALHPIIGWQKIDPRTTLPHALARRLNLLKAQIDSIVPDSGALQDRLNLIKDANEAAENFPVVFSEIEKAQLQLNQIKETAEITEKSLSQNVLSSQSAADEILSLKQKAEALVSKTGEAHRAATSTGLAAAFSDRAKKLNRSAQLWVAALVISLLLILSLGAYNVYLIQIMTEMDKFKSEFIWLRLIAPMLVVGAPVWFAWVATKQINQKYKSAEDYAYKASISRSYEGYRSEAERLKKPELEERLLSVTIDRFEESPLRLLDQKNHGSPLHELLSKGEMIAKAREEIVSGLKRATEAVKPGSSKTEN